MEPVAGFGSRGPGLHRDSKRLDQPSIAHPGWARGFAGAAVETQLEVPGDFRRQIQPAVGHRAHEVNAAARTIRFRPEFQIRGARGGAKAAMDAVEEIIVLDLRFKRLNGLAHAAVDSYAAMEL